MESDGVLLVEKKIEKRSDSETVTTYAFPFKVSFTRPEGGMFIWAALPEDMIALELFEKAREKNVVFVPGNPFYIDGRSANTMRLNYTNCDEKTIAEGIGRLAGLIKMS